MTYSKDDFAENWDSIVTNTHIRLRKTVQFADTRVVTPSVTPVLFQATPFVGSWNDEIKKNLD